MKTELHKLVAEQLSTVAGVDACINWLENCKEAISWNNLNAAIQSAKEDKKERLKKWFQTLTPREQLLALGITLFSGLYTDQFFAALERVVEKVWQKRDSSLQALDHCDLEHLGNYYEFSEVMRGDDFVLRRLTWKDPETGKLLLCIAWESHRRQIITALEEIVQIVQDSAQGKFHKLSDWQIYGNSELQKRLYEGVSEPFADVGLVTAEATSPVQNLLLTLASDDEFIAHNFVATVVAYWYQSNSGKLLRTLRFLYDKDLTIDVQANQQDPDSISRRDRFGATVALAISYASLNDLPNQLHSELCDWLIMLSNSKSSLVRIYFSFHTLAYVIPRHLPQIHKILKGIAEKHQDLTLVIAQGLAAAYANYPDEVLEYLKEWEKGDTKNTLLCTIIRTYGLIDCSLYSGKLTPESAFKQIEIFLKDNKHQIVRRAVIAGMSDRLRQGCLAIAPMLLTQVVKFTKPERNQFIAHLTDIYLAQRAELTGGEGFSEVNKIRYRIWINTDRPLTAIEQVLLQWLGQSQNRVAQQIATQAAIEFARVLDIEEDTELTRLRSLQSLVTNQGEVWRRDGSKPWHENWLAPVAAWLATLQAKVYQPIVQNILPEALIHHKDYWTGMDFVLRKWEKSPVQPIGDDNDLKLKPTAMSLRRGLWVMDNKVPLAIASLGIAVLGLMTIQTAGSQIISLLPKPKTASAPTKPAPPTRSIDNGGVSLLEATGVSDIDSPNFRTGELKVSFTANGTPDDLLSILHKGIDSGQIGISNNKVLYGGKVIGSFTEGNGAKPLIVTLDTEATPEATEALLRNIAYKNTSTPVTLGTRTVQFVLNDGSGGLSKPLTRTISVIAKNQPPTIEVPGTLSTPEGKSVDYGKIAIGDPDSPTVTVQLSVDNGILSVKGGIPQGLKAEDIRGNASNTIELKGSLAKIKTTLANSSAIKYTPNSDFAGDDSLKIMIFDSRSTTKDKTALVIYPSDARNPQQASKTIKIAVVPSNQFPVITLPDNKTVDEDNNINIGGIAIKDPDSKDDKQPVTVILSVKNGSLKVKPNIANGLKADSIKNNASSSVTLKGSIATINATLADPAVIIYQGKQDYNGRDSLKIRVDDGGRGAEKVLAIIVNPVNDPPQLGVSRPVERTLEPSPSPSPSVSITQEEALQLMRDYLRAKREIFAPPFSRELAAKYTMGLIYENIAKPNEGRIDDLKQRNEYFRYGNQDLRLLGFEFGGG